MLTAIERVVVLLPTFEVLVVMALRSVALVGLGWLGARLLRGSLPAARQALWTAVVLGLLALPLLTAMLPAWRVLPFAGDAPPPFGSSSLASVGAESPQASPTRLAVSVPSWVTPALDHGLPKQPSTTLRWSDWGVLAWAGGATVALGIFGFGCWRLRRVRLEGQAASGELCRIARAVARDFDVQRPVRIIVSRKVASPATWGLRHPVIVVPEASSSWSAERCRLVLAHEMAHVARGDWAWRILAQAGCAVYWFNPLAWVAARRLRFEQELACDLAVVDAGARPSVYAYHLLNIARAAAGRQALPLVALDMARQSQMEGRLMSILNDRPTRRLRRALMLPALSIIAALPLVAAVQPQAPPAPAPEPELAPAAPVASAPELAQSAPSPSATPESAPVVPVAPTAVVAPSVSAAPAGLAVPSPVVAPMAASAPSELSESVAPAPALAPVPAVSPSSTALPEPALAPVPSSAPRPVYGVLATNQVAAPVALAPLAPVSPATPDTSESAEWERDIELEERIAAKAAEIEALMEPIHAEFERAMEEGMGEMLEQMELLELEMEPMGEEMSRLGEEMSRRMMETMPDQLAMEEHSRRAEAIAREMEERSRLTAQALEGHEGDRQAVEESVRKMHEDLAPLREELSALHREMAERQRPMADIEELMAPYRAKMEVLREQMAPQRERMEEFRKQFEPRRQEMQRLREERMSEVRVRMEALREELRELSLERARVRRERHEEN